MDEKTIEKNAQNTDGKEQLIFVEDKLRSSFIDYAMSVIVARALPDVRDGLKPVHRRILYAMNDLDLAHNKVFKKSARIIGEILGKYHPHGDIAVYEAVTRMAQDFSLRYPLVDGQGNWGSIDGDNQAAMRYTEARLTKIAEEILMDLEKDTVDFMPNYDTSLKEPTVMPSTIPNLLINGSSGIAVGMATNMPPHNITEISNAIIAIIENPALDDIQLMNYVKGPDFPTGGIIYGRKGIFGACNYGRGLIKLRAKFDEENKKGKNDLIITEIPYTVNKAELVKEIAKLVNDKQIINISDIRDESSRQGIRVVLELKKDTDINVLKNNLYKKTRCQITFPVRNLALINNKPKIFTLKQLITEFIGHRKNVIIRRTQFDLKKAEERMHLLIGFTKALDKLDETIQLIKTSKDVATASKNLIELLIIDEVQAKAILELKLQKLTSMERGNIIDEYNQLKLNIEHLKSILSDEQKIYTIIKEETQEILNNYGDKRRTEIIDVDEEDMDFNMDDIIAEEDIVITLSKEGYIKRVKLEEYKEQSRGGKGVIAATTKDEDYIIKLFSTTTKSTLLIFTNKGRLHWLKSYMIPDSQRSGKGKPIINFINLDPGEFVSSIIPVKEFVENKNLCMITKRGIIKKLALTAFAKPRKGGVIAITLREDDNLIEVLQTDANTNIVLATRNGNAIKFKESELRIVGKTAIGVTGIRLKDDDYCVSALIGTQESRILTITEKGYGKRTMIDEYRETHRAGSGIINIKVSEKNGLVTKVLNVKDEDGILILTKLGMMIRINVKDINIIGRNTQGVRLIRLNDGDSVIDSCVVND